MDRFIELVADVFDIETSRVSMDKNFRTDFDNYSSMTGFALLVMIEDEYGVEIPEDVFLSCNTLEDLYNICSPKKL